jgi:hypothetical protein
MATTTPNYAWVVPTSSDLVKNGATAIETLGDSVDASLWNSGYGQAGKNKIINGDFNINQRAFSSITASAFTFDRWLAVLSDGTSTLTAQTFTLGAAPVAGYESTNFLRLASTGQTATSARTSIEQRIESVRTFAGQTVTISFWAKAASGTPSITPELSQQFGSGGSTFVSGIGATKIPITTSWARYSLTVAVPSISGKTIGTVNNELRLTFWTSAGSDFNTRSASLGIQTTTIDIWGVQVEAGSTATPFQTASGGSYQGELAMCQRYYERQIATVAYGAFGLGKNLSTTSSLISIPFKVTKRVTPTSVDFSALLINDDSTGGQAVTNVVIQADSCQPNTGVVQTTMVGGTLLAMVRLCGNNNVAAYLGFSAEL